MKESREAELALEQGDVQQFIAWLLKRPFNYYNLVEMLVRGPSSYTALQYYTKFPLALKDSRGVDHYCQFRLVPADVSSDQDLLDSDAQATIWATEPAENDRRSQDYLIRAGLMSQEGKMELQVMTSVKTGREPLAFFHPSADWSQRSPESRPWRSLAQLGLTGSHQGEYSPPDLTNLPPGLTIIQPVNSSDPNWINYAKSQAMVLPDAMVHPGAVVHPSAVLAQGMVVEAGAVATFHIPAFTDTISYRSNRYDFPSVQPIRFPIGPTDTISYRSNRYDFLSVQPIRFPISPIQFLISPTNMISYQSNTISYQSNQYNFLLV